jgi:UDP-galactopyranose mutase
MKKYDWLIVGSGLYGSTFAYFAKKADKKCLVIDKRSRLGGNLYCERVEGINVHKYGPHIFHTSNKEVWNFVNSIVPFNRYTNSPVANYRGRLYNLPFNMNTFHQMWGVITPEDAMAKIEEQRGEAMAALNGREPVNLEEQALSMVGQDIYQALIKGYTEKQWGRSCTEIPAFIIRRLPLRFTYDNNYFNDSYQGIPNGGYNKLIEGLLEGVETRVKCDFLANRAELSSLAENVLYTGPIDAFYDYRFGHLSWRTLRFEQEVVDEPNWQGNAVVNYTDRDIPFTRVIEHKHFEMFGDAVYDNSKTVITREYSAEWTPGLEPYYPVNDAENNARYSKYKALAELEKDVVFGGRLAEYKYYDMAPIIERVMRIGII